jgi:hypothetical protein
MKLRTVWIFLCVLQSFSTVEARLVSIMTFGKMVKEAEILVVGEVIEVVDEERIAEDANSWKIPLLRMSAKIQTKRMFSLSEEAVVDEDEMIRFSYQVIDWEKCRGVGNGPEFPMLSIGDVFVFPLRRMKGPDKNSWELIAEEDYGLLVPAVLEPPPLHREDTTGTDFLKLTSCRACMNSGSASM